MDYSCCSWSSPCSTHPWSPITSCSPMRVWRLRCTRGRSSSWRSYGMVSGGIAPRGVDSSDGTSPTSKRTRSRANTVSLPSPMESRCSSPRSTGSPVSPSSWPSPVSSPSRRRSHTRHSARRIFHSRTGVGEPAELGVLSRVIVLESGRLEAGHSRHTEFRALGGEAGGLVQVQLFLVTRHGVLDPREGQVVDLSRVDADCGPNPVEPNVERRYDRREPAFGDGREHGERAASLSLAEGFEGLPLRRRRPAVDEHELGAVAQMDRPGPYSR